MPQPLLPGPAPGGDDHHPDDGDQHPEEARAHRSQGTAKRRHVASEEECLAALSGLPAMVALGMLSTAKANTIRGTYTAILQHLRQKQTSANRGGVNDDVLDDLLLRHPELANLLAPLLSEEQIASIMARAKDGSRGTT
jgi:hypothetical protein